MKNITQYFILLNFLIGTATAQSSIEMERLIAESYYYLLDENDSIANDSTIYYYTEGNAIVEDPYKTYLGRLFDTLEMYFSIPHFANENHKYNLHYKPLSKQYYGKLLQFDSSEIFSGMGAEYLLGYKEKRNWDDKLLKEEHELECDGTECAFFGALTVYEYSESNKLSKRFFLYYNPETESFDTSNFISIYNYEEERLKDFISGKLHPLDNDYYLLEKYIYNDANKLENVFNYTIRYSDGIVTDSSHSSFTYSGDKITGFKVEELMEGLSWIEKANVTLTYTEGHLNKVYGIYTYLDDDLTLIYDTVNILYYPRADGKFDSIVKLQMRSPGDEIEKEYFDYDINGNLIYYEFTGNYNYESTQIEYNYDEFNRLISQKITSESDYNDFFIRNYIYTYTLNGNIRTVEYQDNYNGAELLGVYSYKFYYETIDAPEIETEELSIQLFPNPTNNILNIDINGINSPTTLQLEIYDIQGQQISDQLHTLTINSTLTFDISILASGIYIISVNNGENFIQQKVVIY